MSNQWNGREIVFVEYDIAVGEAVLEAAASDDLPRRRHALYLALVHSARYADDNRPVFSSVDEVRSQPFRLIQRIQRLAGMAADANKIEEVEEDGNPLPVARADVPASARAGNGADGH
jgi:hypothetical protein